MNKNILIIAHQREDFVKYRLSYVNAFLQSNNTLFVLIPASDRNSLFSSIEADIDSRVRIFHYNYNRNKPSISDFFKLIYLIKNIVIKCKIDIVFSIKIFPNLCLALSSVIFLRNKPLTKIGLVAGLGILARNNFTYLVARKIYFRLLKTLNKVIVQNNSDFVLLQNVIGPKKVIKTSGSGVNFKIAKSKHSRKEIINSLSLDYDSNDVIFFCASRLVLEKGILELIEVFSSEYINIKAKLIIVGWFENSKFEKEFNLKVSNLSNVNYLGNHKSLEVFFEFIDYSILLSYYGEGLSRFLLESMQNGKPIVTTITPGCGDLVPNNQNGIIVSNNIDDIVLSVNSLCDLEQSDYDLMSKKSVSLFNENYAFEKVLDQYKRIFFEVDKII
jgi:glycosyltransferase involved in cell wall biosynthesis